MEREDDGWEGGMSISDSIVQQYGIQDIWYYKFVHNYQQGVTQASSVISDVIKVLGVVFNSVILLCLLVHHVIRRYLPKGEEVSLPIYLQRNKCALLLVINLCLIDLSSIIVLYILLPWLLSHQISYSESCALKITAFCFLNFGSTLSTFYLAMERWVKIAYFEWHERIFSRCTVYSMLASVWLSTISFCVCAYFWTSSDKSSAAWICRPAAVTSTPFLLVKPSIVMMFSVVMFVFYGDILAKFWLLRERIEKFKKKQIVDSGDVSHIKFFHKKSVFQEAKRESIFEEKPTVVLVGFKMCQHEPYMVPYEDNYKHIKSQYETNLRKLLHYVKDSKYVLCILACYFLSWIPWILVFFLDFALIRTNFYSEQKISLCGNFSSDNMEQILLLMQEEISKTGLVDSLDNITGDENTICAALARLYEDTALDIITTLYVTCGACSCVLDPLIYAVWYRPVRTQIGQLWHSVKTSVTNNITI